MANFQYNSQLDAFSLYHQVSEESTSKKLGGPDLPALGHAVSGATGTAIANVIVYPLELVITRLKVQNQPGKTQGAKGPQYNGVADAIQKIYDKDGGLNAFYNGCLYDTGKSIADSFLFFLAYNYVRDRRLQANGGHKSLPVGEELLVGMIAGAFGKFFTTPVQQIVTRKQAAAPGSASSLHEILAEIQNEKGLQGFWAGYSATLVLTLNPSLTFLFHTMLLRALVPKTKREKPGPWLTFLVAAASKSLASTITYPFSLAKTRAQVSNSKKEKAIEPKHKTKADEKIAAQLNSAVTRQLTIFTSIARIAQEDGILALYQGVGGEVLKGFFSHGLTMLLKERIHATIIKAYFLILQALDKYPSPEELARRAKDQAHALAAKAKEHTQTLAENTKEQTQALTEKGREIALDAASQGNKTAQAALKQSQDVLQQGQKEAEHLLQGSTEATKSLLWGVVDEEE